MTTSQRDILLDVCIQRAYLDEHQPQRCLNAPQVIANVKHVMAYARLAKLPVVSCVDVDCANRIGADFVHVAPGLEPARRKAPFSLLPQYAVVECDNSLALPLDALGRAQQVIFTKVHRDPFTNPKLDRLLTEIPARSFVVFGVPLENTVRMLVLGLLRRRRRVTVLFDTCGYWSVKEAEMTLRQLGVKGCDLLTARQYIGISLARIAPKLRVRIRPSHLVA